MFQKNIRTKIKTSCNRKKFDIINYVSKDIIMKIKLEQRNHDLDDLKIM